MMSPAGSHSPRNQPSPRSTSTSSKCRIIGTSASTTTVMVADDGADQKRKMSIVSNSSYDNNDSMDEYSSDDEETITKHLSIQEELQKNKESLHQAKLTISSLIEQISDYQSMVEEEKEREKEQFSIQLEELSDELEELKREKNNLAKANIKNLETLMHEIELIEETNNELRESLDQERKQHHVALGTISQLREDLAKKQQQSTMLSPMQQASMISQVLLEFKMQDGAISNIKMVSSKSKDTKENTRSPPMRPCASIIGLEEERNDLLKKLLEEKEHHERTVTQLKDERQRSESNKSNADELLKKIKELIKHHSSILRELDEERELNQQRADQISDLRLQISRPTAPRLNRTHSTFTTLKRTNGSRSNSVSGADQALPPIPGSHRVAGGRKQSVVVNSTIIPGQTTPPHDSPIAMLPPKASVSVTSTLTSIDSTTPPRSSSTPLSASIDENINQILDNNSMSTRTNINSSFDDNIQSSSTESLGSMLLSKEGRALKRGTASLDLHSARRFAKASQLLGTNENMITWLSVDPAPAPIQCMAEVGKQVWVGCSDGSIRVMDKEMQHTIATRTGHAPHGVYTLIAVGKTVWSSSRDSSIKVWSAKSGKLLRELDGHCSHVTSLLLVGSTIWSISADMAIRVWSINSYRCIKKIETKNYLVSMAKFGNQIWIGTESTILRWDSNTYESIDTLSGHKKMVHCMIPVDNYVWTCSSDNLICLWDPQTGRLVRKLTDHKSRVFYLLRVNNHVWSCAWDKTIKIHDIATLALVREIEPVHRDALSCLITIRPTSNAPLQIWSGSWDHTIIIWRSSDPSPPASPHAPNIDTGAAKKTAVSKLEKQGKRGSVRLSLFFNKGESSASLNTPPTPPESQQLPAMMQQSQSQPILQMPPPSITTTPSNNNPNPVPSSPRGGLLSLISPRSYSTPSILSPRMDTSSNLAPRSDSGKQPMTPSPSADNIASSSCSTFTGPIVAHDLIKQNINHSVQCSVCKGKIANTWGKKQVFHCRLCLSNYHSGDCVEKSLSISCAGQANNSTQ
eukprot:gene17728-21138_t